MKYNNLDSSELRIIIPMAERKKLDEYASAKYAKPIHMAKTLLLEALNKKIKDAKK